MSQFYQFTKKHFEFLQMYGYICSNADDENMVSLMGKQNRIDVDFSAVECELTCCFVDDVKNTFTLQDALEYVDIKEFKGIYQLSKIEDIEKGIIYLADVVKRLFDKMDISDPLNFQKVYQYRFDMQNALLENYYYQADIKKAEEHWKNGEYSQVKELYEKHISSLSNAQIKKLEYITKNV